MDNKRSIQRLLLKTLDALLGRRAYESKHVPVVLFGWVSLGCECYGLVCNTHLINFASRNLLQCRDEDW